MRLVAIPDESGEASLWINAAHLVSVQSIYAPSPQGFSLVVELKVDGMPLQRIRLGEHPDKAAAHAAFARLLAELQET